MSMACSQMTRSAWSGPRASRPSPSGSRLIRQALMLLPVRCWEEQAMRHDWRTRRTLRPHPDGQRRWDRAYQLLLAWGTDALPPDASAPIPSTPEEVSREECDLRPRLDSTAGPDSDHRATD